MNQERFGLVWMGMILFLFSIFCEIQSKLMFGNIS